MDDRIGEANPSWLAELGELDTWDAGDSLAAPMSPAGCSAPPPAVSLAVSPARPPARPPLPSATDRGCLSFARLNFESRRRGGASVLLESELSHLRSCALCQLRLKLFDQRPLSSRPRTELAPKLSVLARLRWREVAAALILLILAGALIPNRFGEKPQPDSQEGVGSLANNQGREAGPDAGTLIAKKTTSTDDETLPRQGHGVDSSTVDSSTVEGGSLDSDGADSENSGGARNGRVLGAFAVDFGLANSVVAEVQSDSVQITAQSSCGVVALLQSWGEECSCLDWTICVETELVAGDVISIPIPANRAIGDDQKLVIISSEIVGQLSEFDTTPSKLLSCIGTCNVQSRSLCQDILPCAPDGVQTLCCNLASGFGE